MRNREFVDELFVQMVALITRHHRGSVLVSLEPDLMTTILCDKLEAHIAEVRKWISDEPTTTDIQQGR